MRAWGTEIRPTPSHLERPSFRAAPQRPSEVVPHTRADPRIVPEPRAKTDDDRSHRAFKPRLGYVWGAALRKLS